MLVRRFLASTALTLQRRAAPNLSSFRALDTASRGTGTCSFNRRHTIGYAAGMHSSLRRCLSTSSNNSVISLEELQRLIESAVSSRPAPRSYVLIDVREMSELEHGMIPSAFNVPVGELAEALLMAPQAFLHKYRFPQPAKQENIVFYCKSGARSSRATAAAKDLGFQKSANFKGSFMEWFQRGY